MRTIQTQGVPQAHIRVGKKNQKTKLKGEPNQIKNN